MKDDELYMKFDSKEEAEEKIKEIAAGHRIDKSPLMQHLDKCEEVVKTWPKWKLQSVRDALGIPNHAGEANDMGDDPDLEYHVSKNCKVIDYD